MKHVHRKTVLACLAGLVCAAPLHAAQVEISIQLPRHKHRPYVAVWVESEDRVALKDLAVWHEGGGTRKSGKGGKKEKRDKYLKDLRVWWRAGGSEKSMPAEGVSGATRAAGTHVLRFQEGEHPLGDLKPGSYRVVVEASREDGGQELVRLPLPWPAPKNYAAEQAGNEEIGKVSLVASP